MATGIEASASVSRYSSVEYEVAVNPADKKLVFEVYFHQGDKISNFQVIHKKADHDCHNIKVKMFITRASPLDHKERTHNNIQVSPPLDIVQLSPLMENFLSLRWIPDTDEKKFDRLLNFQVQFLSGDVKAPTIKEQNYNLRINPKDYKQVSIEGLVTSGMNSTISSRNENDESFIFREEQSGFVDISFA